MLEVMGSVLAESGVTLGDRSFTVLAATMGAALVIMFATKGIGHIGASAVEAIARQPEAGGRIFTSMLIASALIEGITFFGLLICFMASRM